MPLKYKAEAWDDLKKWLENVKKEDHNLKAFADFVLGGMKDILQARRRERPLLGRCIVCGSRSDELHRHPQGAKQDIPFCSDCIQSLALQWFADNLSVKITKFYNKHGNERPLVLSEEGES